MKNFFSIQLNLQSGANQAEIMQWLKAEGAEVIQVSDGLCIKSEQSEAELRKSLAEKNWQSLSLTALNPVSALADSETAADVKAFLNS